MFTMTIRLGAGLNEVEIDGHVFDRIALTRAENRKLTRMTAKAFRVAQERRAQS